MQKFKLTTNLVPLVDCCTYRGQFKPEHILPEDYDFEDFDFDQYTDKIVEFLKPFFQKWAKQFSKIYFPIELEVIQFKSPKYYNYGGDVIYFDVSTDVDYIDFLETDDKLQTLVEKHLRTYQSGPGFINEMPNTWDKLNAAFEDDPERALAAVLTALHCNDDQLCNIFPDYSESCGADFEPFLAMVY